MKALKVFYSNTLGSSLASWTDRKGDDHVTEIYDNVMLFTPKGTIYAMPVGKCSVTFNDIQKVDIACKRKASSAIFNKPYLLKEAGKKLLTLYIPTFLLEWKYIGLKSEVIWGGDAIAKRKRVRISNVDFEAFNERDKKFFEYNVITNVLRFTEELSDIKYTEQQDERTDIMHKLQGKGVTTLDDYDLKSILENYNLVDKNTGEVLGYSNNSASTQMGRVLSQKPKICNK